MLKFRDKGYAIEAVDKKRKIYIEITPFTGFLFQEERFMDF